MTPHRRLALGVALTLTGALLLVDNFMPLGGLWWLAFVGAGLIVAAFSYHKLGSLAFPGIILFITAGSLELYNRDILNYELWRIWPILVGSFGLGLLLSWPLQAAGWRALVFGGFFLFVGSVGLGAHSFTKYQFWLRKLIEHWDWMLVGVLVLLVVHHWTVRSQRISSRRDAETRSF